MEEDYTFTRRIGAVLLADVAGFSSLTQEDDEGTAQAIERMLAIVRQVVPDAKPLAGDTIRAVFDNVVSAVQAALEIQRRLATDDSGGPHLQIRIGIHIGDLLIRGDAILGDAINVAARLQAIAKPGAICISDGVYQHVRNKIDETFVDLGRQQLKNIEYPVHAYMLVPREMAHDHSRAVRSVRRRRIMNLSLVAAVVCGAAVAGWLTWQPQRSEETKRPQGASRPIAGEDANPPTLQPSEPAPAIALGVMLFKSSLGAKDQRVWMREALRDGLNTQLSQLSGVKVYSKEFLDFLIARQGLSEIEAATKLGIKKMLSGSFVVHGNRVQIETHVVDVASGVLEASYTTSGRENEFLTLQSQMVQGVIARLPVTESVRKMMLAQQNAQRTQQNTDVDALKALMAAEGAVAATALPEPTQAPEQTSSLPQGFSFASLFSPAAAFAKEGDGEEARIVSVLQRYREATQAKQLNAVAALHIQFPPEQRTAQQRYFNNATDLTVAIDNVDVAVAGDEAVVSYTRTDKFVDAKTGRPVEVAIRLTKMMQREAGEWKLAGAK